MGGTLVFGITSAAILFLTMGRKVDWELDRQVSTVRRKGGNLYFFGKRELGNCLFKHYVIWKAPECVCVCVLCERTRDGGRDGMGRRGAPREGVKLWLAGRAVTEVLRKAVLVLSFELQ